MDQNRLVEELVYVGFNGRVIALDRRSGAVVWRWAEGTTGSFVALLPDGDTLFVSCRGYTWALDPATGENLWHQPLKGEGFGVPCLATMRAVSEGSGAAAQVAADEAARATMSS